MFNVKYGLTTFKSAGKPGVLQSTESQRVGHD